MSFSSASCLAMERLACFFPERLNRVTMLVGASLLLFNAGCGGSDGPERIAVVGTVTLDGSPMSFGSIRFIPKKEEAGPGAMARIIGGEFAFTADDGPVVANHRVEIEATDHQNFAIDDEAAFAAQTQKTGKSPLAINPVPANYNRQSTLTATVTNSNSQSFTFDLKSEP